MIIKFISNAFSILLSQFYFIFSCHCEMSTMNIYGLFFDNFFKLLTGQVVIFPSNLMFRERIYFCDYKNYLFFESAILFSYRIDNKYYLTFILL